MGCLVRKRGDECALPRPAHSTVVTTINDHKPLVKEITIRSINSGLCQDGKASPSCHASFRHPVQTVAATCPASSCKQHECALPSPAHSTAVTLSHPIVLDPVRAK